MADCVRMTDLEPKTERIRWQDNDNDNDAEAAQPQSQSQPGPSSSSANVSGGRPMLHRGRSAGSLSIHSAHSNTGAIDPSAALPIQYRTLSIDVEDYKRKGRLGSKTKDAAATEDLADLEWHTLPVDEVVRRLSSSLDQGLSAEQATRRAAHYGKNAPSPPPTHRVRKTLGYFFKGFGSILLIGAILVFVAWKPLGQPPASANLALAIVLVAVFVIQAAFNMWQDWSSSRVMASIKTMLPAECLVLRDGVRVATQAADLVPGDMLLITAGNKLPADVRFTQVSSDAKMDRAILTGESVPLAATTTSTDDNYLETKCIGLQGTHCVSGTCTGIVVATGNRTVFGRIAKLTNEPKTGLSTLEREVLNFVYIICSIMFLMIIVVVIVWATWLRHAYPGWINVPTLIVDCVSVAVAFIPEGLPVALTASLTISANMMRKNKILCKSLKTVETLGAVSVICSDKTGTLTENKMVVTDCFAGGKAMSADAARAKLNSTSTGTVTVPEDISISAIRQLRAVAGLCNAGEFDASTRHLEIAKRRVHGDATDQAILRFAEGLDQTTATGTATGTTATAIVAESGGVAELRRSWTTRFTLAFNSRNKFMVRVLGINRREGLTEAMSVGTAAIFETRDLLLTIKGAPEILLARCAKYTSASGEALPLRADERAHIESVKDTWSAQGRRVLLLAHKTISAASIHTSPSSSPAAFESEMLEQVKEGLTLVGLVGIVDPPRSEIPSVVRTLRGAGIRIFMVTGDFALTAQAIAAECGIITNESDNVASVADLSRNPMQQHEKKEQYHHHHHQKTVSAVHSSGILASTSGSGDNSDDIPPPPMAPSSSIVLTGPDLLTLNEAQWDRLATSYDEVVFARTTPEQKLRIVRELQARGHVVGMTGDGVNDAPALRAADIGIAVGGGSDIAVEAADMVLLESFSSMVEAVRFGRMLFDNLKKTIAYLLPAGSFSEFWPVMTNVVFGLPQVLGSFLMIIICCFTDCLAATSLAYEKPEADVLRRPPRRIGVDRLVDWQLIVQSYGFVGVLETVASFSMSYWYLSRRGIPFSALWFSFGNVATPPDMDADGYTQALNVASSIYFVTLVVMQWFNLLGVRTRRLSIFQHPPLFNRATQNIWLFPAILFALVMAFFWLYIPALQPTLNTADVPVEHWFLPMTFGLGVLFLEETRKFFVRKYPGGILARMAW